MGEGIGWKQGLHVHCEIYLESEEEILGGFAVLPENSMEFSLQLK